MKFRISFVFLFLSASLIGCLTFFLRDNQPDSYYKSKGEISGEAAKSPSFVRENEPKTSRYLRKSLFLRGKIPLKMAEYGYIAEENVVLSPEDHEENAPLYIFPDENTADLSKYGDYTEKTGKNVYVVSLLPSVSDEENDKIDKENDRLLQICEENGYYFLDVNSYLKDKNGRLPEIFSSDDGVTKEVYGRIAEYLLSHTVD